MTWKLFISISLVFVLSELPVSALSIEPIPAVSRVATAPAASDEIEIFERVNREREKFRLQQLDWDDDAARVARSYSQRMAREGFFDHIDPDGNSVVERAERSRLRRWSMIGENLFLCTGYEGYTRLAVTGWMKSPTHRQNILDRRWTATGIGVAQGRGGRIYVTQVFLER
jgi:uncharacterized protein YkwD